MVNNSEVYTVKEIQAKLAISRNCAYNLMKNPPFPVIKLGSSIRVSKVVFDAWLQGSYHQI